MADDPPVFFKDMVRRSPAVEAQWPVSTPRQAKMHKFEKVVAERLEPEGRGWMVAFKTLWDNHVGRGYVCDTTDFGNQCAMRMGKALEDSGIKLAGYKLKRCTTYSLKYRDHKPGHIRAAQELANIFYRTPKLLGPIVKRHILTGTINDNIAAFRRKQGMIFIMNGWGNTDHIDVWDGNIELMKGSLDTASYRKRGKQVWFWEMP